LCNRPGFADRGWKPLLRWIVDWPRQVEAKTTAGRSPQADFGQKHLFDDCCSRLLIHWSFIPGRFKEIAR